MKKTMIFSLLTIFVLLLAACAPASPAPSVGGEFPTPGAAGGQADDQDVTGIPTGPVDEQGLPETGQGGTGEEGETGEGLLTETPGALQEETPGALEDDGDAAPEAQLTETPGAVEQDDEDVTGIPTGPVDEQGLPETGAQQGLFPSNQPNLISGLLNLQVADSSGNNIGQVLDVILSAEGSELAYVVVRQNNGSTNLVPWQAFLVDTSSAQPRIQLHSGLNLDGAPTTDLDQEDFSDPDWDRSSRVYWNDALQGAGIQTISDISRGIPNAIRSTELLSSALSSIDAEALGNMVDVVVDPLTGQVEMLLIDASQIAGVPDMVIPVPVDALQFGFDDQTGRMTVTIDPDLLRNAPTFDLTQLQEFLMNNQSLQYYWEQNR